jgi:hypothetical protein
MPEGWDPAVCDKVKAALAAKPPPPDDMIRAIMQAMGMSVPPDCEGKGH